MSSRLAGSPAQQPRDSSVPVQAGASLMRDLLAIFGCELAGEITQRAGGMPVPGPVIGLVLLLSLLVLSGGAWATLRTNAQGLLKYLPMMFVPAGTGVAAHAALIRAEWLPITAAVVGSSVIAIVVTGLAMRATERLLQHDPGRSSAKPLVADPS
jgi:holin-like protein